MSIPGVAVPGTVVGASALTSAGGAQGTQGVAPAIASPSTPGSVNILSGNAGDYIGGDNACHPGSTDFDAAPPASPSAYDDEFTAGTLNPKWTLSTPSGWTQGLIAPTYLQQHSPNGAAAGTATAIEAIVTAAGFMFQFRLKTILSSFSSPTVGAQPSVTAYCGLTTATKGFGLQISNSSTQPVAGSYYYVTQIYAVRASGLATTIANSVGAGGNAYDWRIRLGIIGSQLVAQVSLEGVNWMTVWSESFSAGASLGGTFPTSLTLALTTSLANNAGMAAWDYVRKTA